MLKYKDFIDKGEWHEISYIDDNWILKSPLKKRKSDYDGYDRLELFMYHIDIMSKYPEIFPKVKKLDKRRAAIEKLDVIKPGIEMDHIISILKKDGYIYALNRDNIVNILYRYQKELNLLKEYGLKDEICNRWYNFIILVKNSNLIKDTIINKIDFNQGNFGIDKNGNIKLIDF